MADMTKGVSRESAQHESASYQGEKDVTAVVLAAGKGTRMNSPLPKVLHEVAGQSMLGHVVSSLKSAGVESVVLVLSEQLDDFEGFLSKHPELKVALQKERRGTADAVASSGVFFENIRLPAYAQLNRYRGEPLHSKSILICAGDTPAVPASFYRELLSFHKNQNASLTVVGMKIPNPTGYGRLILNGDSELLKIVEQKDASQEELRIDICNSGIMIADTAKLFYWLDQVKPLNAQKEYYLTDVVEIARQMGERVLAYVSGEPEFFAGVNDLNQKAAMHEFLMARRRS